VLDLRSPDNCKPFICRRSADGMRKKEFVEAFESLWNDFQVPGGE
jgi:hypothetical protein